MKGLSGNVALKLFGIAGVGGLLAVLFLFNPADYGFYPRCLLFTLTGLECPGCGALRATHQLLHLHFQQAWELNPLLTSVALGGPVLLGLIPLYKRFKLEITAAFLVLIAVFTVLRNLGRVL